jgi:hypothetical protein
LITIQYYYHLLIIFWKKYLLLSQVAKKILCVQEASTAFERDFSVSGYTVWDRRNALLPSRYDDGTSAI